jgi:integrase
MPRAADYFDAGRIKHLKEDDARRVMDTFVDVVKDPTTATTRDTFVTADNARRYALGGILGLGCGMRIGEVCATKKSDINFGERLVSVNQTTISYKGKGGERYRTEVGPT